MNHMLASLLRLTPIALFSALSAQAFTFSEPQALKVGWQAQALYLGDLDQDKREDLAFIDNDMARVVLRFGLKEGEEPIASEVSVQKDKWNPVLENAPYTKTWVTTGVTAYDLIFVQLDGDNKKDMIYTTDRDEIVVHFQKDDRRWSKVQTLKLRALKNNWTTLAAEDLDGDGDADLAILGKYDIAIIKNDGGKLQKPTYYPCGEGSYNLQITDINRDGMFDLAYQDDDTEETYIRLQQDGLFPAEQVLGVDSPSTMISFTDGEQPSVISLSMNTSAMERYQIASEVNDLEKGELSIFSYSLAESSADSLEYSRVDFDQDGDLDLIVADPKGTEIKVYLHQENGRFATPVASATVDGIQSLKVADFIPGELLECVIFSADENMIGVSSLQPDGTCGFPAEITVEKSPTSLTAADFDANGSSEIAYTSEDALHFISWTEGEWKVTETKIEEIGEDRIRGLKPFDVNQDGRLDLLVILQRDPMKILLQQEDGAFQLAEEQSGFSGKLTTKVPESALSSADFDGDGRDELMITREKFLRAIRLNAEGQLEVVKQINVQDKAVSLQAGALANVMGDEAPELIFYEKKKKRLLVCDLEGETLSSSEVPLSSFVGLEAAEDDIFLYDGSQVLRVPLKRKLTQAIPHHSYQTALKDFYPTDFRVGDFNNDGFEDVVVVDSRKSHILEVLEGSQNGWESQQYFVIFEADRHYRGKKGGDYQPHDFHIHDLNGDGKKDLVLHIHDRVLSYLQQ